MSMKQTCHACGGLWGGTDFEVKAHRAACKAYNTYCATMGRLATPLTKVPSQRPPGGWVKPVTYAPVKVDEKELAKAVDHSEKFRVLLDQQLERHLKYLTQPCMFVEPVKEPEADAIEARCHYYMNVGPTIQGTFYIPPDDAPTIDPLDVEYDGAPLRKLLESDQAARRELNPFASCFTPAQRAAVSAHWSAQLRAKVEASEAADAACRPSVVVDLEDP
jgi:hypothetical protein